MKNQIRTFAAGLALAALPALAQVAATAPSKPAAPAQVRVEPPAGAKAATPKARAKAARTQNRQVRKARQKPGSTKKAPAA